MEKIGLTVVGCEYSGDVPKTYYVVRDYSGSGEIRGIPLSFEQMKAMLQKSNEYFVRNLNMAGMSEPYKRFPSERDGNLAGSIISSGMSGNVVHFRVVGKLNGKWYMDVIDEEEAVYRTKRGIIVGATVRGKSLKCKIPVKQENFDGEAVAQEPLNTKHIDITLLYITEASDEKGNALRYAGFEFAGDEAVIDALVPGLTEKSLALREEYYKKFGRTSEELSVQTAPGYVFVVLPYEDVINHLTRGKRAVKISRVVVSAVGFRGGGVLDESRVTLTSTLGSGELRGSNGILDNAVRELEADVKEIFRTYQSLRIRRRRKTDKNG